MSWNRDLSRQRSTTLDPESSVFQSQRSDVVDKAKVVRFYSPQLKVSLQRLGLERSVPPPTTPPSPTTPVSPPVPMGSLRGPGGHRATDPGESPPGPVPVASGAWVPESPNDRLRRPKSFSFTMGESNARMSELSTIVSKVPKNEFTMLFEVLKSPDSMFFDHYKKSHRFKTLLVQQPHAPINQMVANTLKRRGHTVTNTLPDIDLISQLHQKDPFSMIIINQCTCPSSDNIHVDGRCDFGRATTSLGRSSPLPTIVEEAATPASSSSSTQSYHNNSSVIDAGYRTTTTATTTTTHDIDGQVVDFIRDLRMNVVGSHSVIIVISKSDEPAEWSLLLDAGANDYIHHPLSSILLDVRLNCAEKMVGEHHCMRKADELANSTRKIINCIEYSGEGIEIWDADGYIKYLNHVTSKAVGYARWEILGKKFSNLIDNQDIIPAMWATLTVGKSWHGSIRTKHQLGKVIYFEANVSPVFDGFQRIIYYVCSKRDVTQRRMDEESRTAHQEKTLESSRWRLNKTSHDIRTPMNSIIGMTELLCKTATSEDQLQFLEIVQRASNSLLNILNDILDISKIESGKMDVENIEFDIRTTIEEVCELMGERAQSKALNLMCFIHPSTPHNLIGDSCKLKQIITNLIGNAVKFTDNGEIIVTCQVVNIESGTTTLKLEVKDTGIGIKKEALPLLFKAFTQAEGSIARQYAGSGLGLAICKELAQLAFKGEIGVESQYGLGSTFWTILKFKSVPKESPSPSPSPSSSLTSSAEEHPVGGSVQYTVSSERPPDFKGARVLMVGSNANQVKFLKEQMSAWNIALDSSDPPGALNKWNESITNGRHYSMVIIDYPTAGFHVLGVSQTLHTMSKEAGINVPFLLLLPLKMRSPQLEKEAKSSGINEVVTKPIRMCNLLECTISMLGVRRRSHRMVRVEPIQSPHDKLEIRTLVVDDNHMNQMVIRKMLESIGCKPDIVSSGREALDRFDNNHRYDLVFLDISMAGMDGMQVAKAIRQREQSSSNCSSGRGHGNGHQLPQLRTTIIATTAHASKEDQARCLNSGMDDFLAKPIKLEKLSELVSKWRQNKWQQLLLTNNNLSPSDPQDLGAASPTASSSGYK
ncbi:hypothetical protein SAMD00019534_016340 [Acytostelium subglobosum LB1]|uniref:hypothetical protein n=1 Tax=Acytostelium subglobosum LB1 TaxID=1410327 RepID=UPI00064492EE|nr:hypothetical protein SAMD00019534_016340 [Acytostelium subglobosum LB1]GAM18459.1 hypothetical protein SAMD00019534_016340 [Acytostelium subglobosum LB1]|eukprot:XP_012757679.1 hypothetical protein SAMD00019534_016340 [Acytostelium subglobosum LB1]